jgi:hypothetical protein
LASLLRLHLLGFAPSASPLRPPRPRRVASPRRVRLLGAASSQPRPRNLRFASSPPSPRFGCASSASPLRPRCLAFASSVSPSSPPPRPRLSPSSATRPHVWGARLSLILSASVPLFRFFLEYVFDSIHRRCEL